MDTFWNVINSVNDVIWHEYVLYTVLGVGVLFTIWSIFGQYRALTHGVQVVRGKYDDKADPGAINHFQALSTALSATVGLGNIAGVAIAISLGGPGSVFWMWVVGLVGMCLKMTEVTQSMLFRDTTDPKDPHGGPMWVCKKGFAKISPALAPLGIVVGGIFCFTLLISTATGGNMFQAWNVADISFTYFGIPKIVTGIVLALAVGMVIIGGIRRIGEVAGRIVPFMCALYILAGLYVIIVNIGEIPALFGLIFYEAFNPSEATGAFIGGTAGYGFLKGMQRALFSNEAGQGSAPIAHSAAKTDEPVREGIVAGLEPFVDTICVCTITALVILLSGAWNREPALGAVGGAPTITMVTDSAGNPLRDDDGNYHWRINDVEVEVKDEVEASAQMREDSELFFVVEGYANDETGMNRHRVQGRLNRQQEQTAGGEETVRWIAIFDSRNNDEKKSDHPIYSLKTSTDDPPQGVYDGVYFDFKGATLTAKSYDRVLPGLGKWIVPATAWLFAFSTIISWSYYGEQGVIYLLGTWAVMFYRIIYCGLIIITAQLVRTETQLDILSTLGTGVMLWANIPIMLIFGPIAMKAYHDYFRRFKSGEMEPAHKAPPITDVVSGEDVEE